MRNWQKEAKELLQKFDKDLVKYWDDAMRFLLDYQSEESDLGIVDEFTIDEMVKD